MKRIDLQNQVQTKAEETEFNYRVLEQQLKKTKEEEKKRLLARNEFCGPFVYLVGGSPPATGTRGSPEYRCVRV